MSVPTRQSVQRAAQVLRGVIERAGPWDEATLDFLAALDPILKLAERGEMDPPIDEEGFPNPYDFRDQGTQDLPELDAALAEFSSEALGEDEEVLDFIQSLLDAKKGGRS